MPKPNDNKIQLYKDTIRLLLDTLEKPISETNYIERLEAIEAGEIVYGAM